jgi:hypothetical protein
MVAEADVPAVASLRSKMEPRKQPALKQGAPMGCKADWKPYHVLLTAQSGPYQDWQSRIMYYHFKKQQRLNPCTEMVNFTRCRLPSAILPSPSTTCHPTMLGPFHHLTPTRPSPAAQTFGVAVPVSEEDGSWAGAW